MFKLEFSLAVNNSISRPITVKNARWTRNTISCNKQTSNDMKRNYQWRYTVKAAHCGQKFWYAAFTQALALEMFGVNIDFVACQLRRWSVTVSVRLTDGEDGEHWCMARGAVDSTFNIIALWLDGVVFEE